MSIKISRTLKIVRFVRGISLSFILMSGMLGALFLLQNSPVRFEVQAFFIAVIIMMARELGNAFIMIGSAFR